MLSAVIICPTSQVVNVLIYNCSAHRNSSAIVPHATWQIIEQVFILTVLTIIILGAFLGNLLVIVSIVYFTKLRTLTNAFLLSLAVADFLVGIIVMPFSMIKVMFGWYFGKAFCTIHTVMDVMLCTSSIMNLSCIAFDRYYAVCYRLRYRFRVSRKRVTTLLLVCWVLPGLVSFVPLLLGLHLTGLETIHSQLDPHDCVFIVNIPYALCASVISSYLPMLVMLAAYGKIFQVARIQARQIYTMENGSHEMDATRFHHSTSTKKERKAAKTLGIIIGCFLFCWLPFFTANIANALLGYQVHHIVLDVFVWLGYVNSALNPLLYALFNKSFRRAFGLILDCTIFTKDYQNNNLSNAVRPNSQLATLSH
ncbi:LOW QUALITY PROTEIN: 5-hydroxytryptamine receptor 4-like [Leucoraja erinacea]|uniref:LOW QUALITY PROTEIN: 5-hydroxytryptamine receptor 4-like n=1 Tax=Leucoraja erinaceus TaxID=7782 RepID=UPI0024540362|nr:LOW QUALITY PROTEIN: 5-hydroxytryptamine receptor 4-like [Leucoraja erinacea]